MLPLLQLLRLNPFFLVLLVVLVVPEYRVVLGDLEEAKLFLDFQVARLVLEPLVEMFLKYVHM